MRILICLKQVPDTTGVTLTDDLTLEREFVAQVLENARMMEDDARSYVDRMAN